MITLITANGVALPNPAIEDGYTVTRNALVKAERNARGTIIGELIAWKYTISFSYPLLTEAQFAAITAAISGTSLTFFDVPITFWDPHTQTYRTGRFYADATKGTMFEPPPSATYRGCSFELIEQ